MSGLLELLGASTGDPAKDNAINQGILSAGLSLMQARGRLGPALGQAGQAGMMGFQQAMQQDYQSKMQKAQLDELARKKLMQDREEAFIQGLPSPQAQANQAAYKASGSPLGTVGSRLRKDGSRFGNDGSRPGTGGSRPLPSAGRRGLAPPGPRRQHRTTVLLRGALR